MVAMYCYKQINFACNSLQHSVQLSYAKSGAQRLKLQGGEEELEVVDWGVIFVLFHHSR